MAAEIKGRGKTIFVQADLMKMGYPREMLEELKRSDDFPEFGHIRRTFTLTFRNSSDFERRETDLQIARR